RSEAPALMAELVSQSPGRREMLVRNSRRFRSFSLCLLLLDRSREVSPDDPRGGEGWALLALHLADFLDAEVYGHGLIEDVRARAWSFLANTRRIAGDLLGAERAFARAEEHLRQGTRDRLERAQVLVLKATLRSVQCHFAEAERLLRRALSIWLWREASGLPAALSEPHLALRIHHNLAIFLINAGKFLEAEGVLLHNRRLYDGIHVPGGDLCRQWAEALLARGLGRMAEAETLFTELRSMFLDQGRMHDAAEVTMELALVFLATGRTAETEDLAHEALAVFAALGVEREALAAFLLA